MYWYYLVLKKCGDLIITPTKDYYYDTIKIILPQSILSFTTFELDSLQNLHCNLVFCYSRKIDYTNISFPNCHLHFGKINNKYDMYNVMKYIHKDYENSHTVYLE